MNAGKGMATWKRTKDCIQQQRTWLAEEPKQSALIAGTVKKCYHELFIIKQSK